MELSAAEKRIEKMVAAMQAVCRHPVFDEWVIISVSGGDFEVESYHGPREGANLVRDTAAIYDSLTRKAYYPGEFDFSFEGHDERFDAFMAMGNGLFVLFNNMSFTTEGITSNPLWRKAQGEFVNLGDAFAADPVSVASK